MIKNRGIALFIVLGMFFIVTLLGNIALSIIANQSRLTHHSVTRAQALYAAQAAGNLAFEKLRTGVWPVPAPNVTQTHYMCRACGYPLCASAGVNTNCREPLLPPSINDPIQIDIIGTTGAGGACPYPSGGFSARAACIRVRTDYSTANP